MADQEESSSIAGLVLVGALLAFAVLMFLANFSGQMAQPTDKAVRNGELQAPPKGAKSKMAKGKSKGKAKGKAPPLIDPVELTVLSPLDGQPAAPDGAPNIVYVVLTAARRDQLTPYGAQPGVTPFIQRLSDRGVVFDDVISESPYSRASGSALFSGRHSWLLDMVEPSPRVSQKVLPDEVDTLPELLQRAGWYTMGLTGNFNMNTTSGIPQGFDVYRNAQANGFAPGRRAEAPMMKAAAQEWLDARPDDRPFFLYLGLIDLHAPIRRVETEVENFDPDKPNAEYRAALNRIDGVLEDLYAKLKAQGQEKNTLFVITADHGEGLNMPEHHGMLHGRLLYDSSVVVPWVLSGPGVAEGHHVKGITAQVDVVPTVLELVGLPLPPNLDGRSWAALTKGEGDTTERQRAYSATWHFGADRASVWTRERQCQLDFDSVGIEDDFADACYDRATDPTFTKVVTDRKLTDELDAWHTDISKLITSSAPQGDQEGKPKAKGPSKAKTPPAKGKAKGKAKGANP